MENKIDKLNLGSGNEIKDGFINVDFKQNKGVDIVHDLNKHPWPFENDTFKEVFAENVIEHLDNFIHVDNFNDFIPHDSCHPHR